VIISSQKTSFSMTNVNVPWPDRRCETHTQL
jgi:hypothetical protein